MANDLVSYAEKLVNKLILKGYLLEVGLDIKLTEKGEKRIAEIPYEIFDFRYTNKPVGKEIYEVLIAKINNFAITASNSDAEKLIFLESQLELERIKHGAVHKKADYH
jgi:hypothetical protein